MPACCNITNFDSISSSKVNCITAFIVHYFVMVVTNRKLSPLDPRIIRPLSCTKCNAYLSRTGRFSDTLSGCTSLQHVPLGQRAAYGNGIWKWWRRLSVNQPAHLTFVTLGSVSKITWSITASEDKKALHLTPEQCAAHFAVWRMGKGLHLEKDKLPLTARIRGGGKERKKGSLELMATPHSLSFYLFLNRSYWCYALWHSEES